MAKKNTKPKAEAMPEDEQNTVQQANEDEQNAVQQANEDEQNAGRQANEDEGAGGATSGTDGTTTPSKVESPVKLVVISARGLALRQEPNKQSAMLAVLPNGTVLTDRAAEVTAEGWLPVTTRDGKNGWVDGRFVTVVD